MSEYWKSTPKYWCKHCGVFVRDTKLERTNHEATGKHQGAIKRSLRDLHRNAEQKERDKERAKREVERLNGVVSGGSASASSYGIKYGGKPVAQQQQGVAVTEAERQRQLEQLAEMGVNIPTELRGNMAMAGEWAVTSTRVIEEAKPEGEEDAKGDAHRATGVKRERERTEEEKEQEEAIKGLFGKRRRWGVDSKAMPGEEDAELDALLSGPLVVKAKKEKEEEEEKGPPQIKKEETSVGAAESAAGGGEEEADVSSIKKEPGEDENDAGGGGGGGDGSGKARASDASATLGEADATAVVFKKRKPKNLRQK